MQFYRPFGEGNVMGSPAKGLYVVPMEGRAAARHGINFFSLCCVIFFHQTYQVFDVNFLRTQ